MNLRARSLGRGQVATVWVYVFRPSVADRCRLTGQVPTTSEERRSRKYPFDTEIARPVVTRAPETKDGTGSST